MENRHTTIIGVSGSGKTCKAFKLLKNSKIPVLYYNYKHQEIEFITKYKTVSGKKNSLREIDYCLRKYGFVNYLVADSKQKRDKELEKIVEYAMKSKTFKEIILLIDESSSIVREGMREHPLIEVARVGRSYGVILWAISQRLAGLSNEVIAQADTLLIHRLKIQDYKYLNNLGYKGEEIKEMLKSVNKYPHVELKGDEMELIKSV